MAWFHSKIVCRTFRTNINLTINQAIKVTEKNHVMKKQNVILQKKIIIYLYINITTLKQGAWCKKSKSLVALDKWCWQGLVSQKNTFLKMTCKNKLISASKIIQHIILFPPAETQCLRLNWFTSCLNEESNLEHFWSTFLSWAKEEFCFFRPTQNFRH